MTDNLDSSDTPPVSVIKDPPKPVPPSPLLAVLPDSVAIAGFVLLSVLHVLTGETAAGFILAVLAGRLYPRSVRPADGGSPPSGLLSIVFPLIFVSSWLTSHFSKFSKGVLHHGQT